MRSSHANWILLAVIAATTCVYTGCGFSRLGKNVSNMKLERPRLMSWRRDRSDTEIASTTPRPPSSSIPPGSGSGTADSGSRNFPSEPAPGGNYHYASTSGGSGNYSSTNSSENYSQGGGYNDSYVASSGAGGTGDAGGGAQRGFYNPEYNSTAGGSQYGNTGGGYDNYGGSSRDYGPSYGGSATRNYEVADRRGDSYGDYGGSGTYGETSTGSNQYGGSQYGDNQQYGGSSYGDSQYGDQQSGGNYGGGSQYGGDSDSRFVSPNSGGSNYDDYQSPAQDNYNSSYGSGGSYDSSYGAPTSGGTNYGSPSSTSGSTQRWLPGSTKTTTPYDQQQQLSPPTSSWGN